MSKETEVLDKLLVASVRREKLWAEAWHKLWQFCYSEIQANTEHGAGGVDEICSEQLTEVLEQMTKLEKEMEEKRNA